MIDEVAVSSPRRGEGRVGAILLLLIANAALALGPLLVRQTGAGPVTAGVWRLALAVPLLWMLAAAIGQRPWRSLTRADPRVIGAVALAALFFAADLAAWHAGILMTKLGNATLLGNISSLIFAAYGLWLARTRPDRWQTLALLLAPVGTGLLIAGSLELGPRHVRGDLLAGLAGLLYFGYLVLVDRARAALPPLPLLAFASAVGAVALAVLAWALDEELMPPRWDMMVLLAVSSQLVGQGLLVAALGRVSPLTVGIAFLTQPVVSALAGWIVYGEGFAALDWIGAALVAAALLLVALRPPPRRAT